MLRSIHARHGLRDGHSAAPALRRWPKGLKALFVPARRQNPPKSFAGDGQVGQVCVNLELVNPSDQCWRCPCHSDRSVLAPFCRS
jgi:hypothetical protein